MPPNDELERSLLAVAQHADRQAFARLFRYFAPRIKSFMLRAGCTPELADEVAQETMVTVWRKAALFEPGHAGVSTWVFTIARNLRVDLHRRLRRLGDTVDLDPQQWDDVAVDRAAAPARPDDQLLSGQVGRRVREAMAQLPDEQAMVVRLSFFEEQPHAEIARVLGLPLGTVKSRIRLAVGALRRLLGDFE